MNTEDYVSICIPKEFIGEFAEIINNGILHTKLSRETRKSIKMWWEAESELIEENQNYDRQD